MTHAHTALQRVIVRMLFDPKLVERFYGGDSFPELDEQSQDWLRAVPQPAWTTDRYRRSRGLHALLEEFPVSAALATTKTGDVRSLDAYFSSAAFHDCIQHRGSLALSFGDWLRNRAGDVARLETAFARARRPQPPQGSGWVLAPGYEPIELAVGTVRRYLAVREQLGPDPISQLLDRPDLSDELPPIGEVTENLLIEGGASANLSIGHVSAALHDLLEASRIPQSRAQLDQIAVSLGASAEEARTIVQDLIDEELILEIA